MITLLVVLIGLVALLKSNKRVKELEARLEDKDLRMSRKNKTISELSERVEKAELAYKNIYDSGFDALMEKHRLTEENDELRVELEQIKASYKILMEAYDKQFEKAESLKNECARLVATTMSYRASLEAGMLSCDKEIVEEPVVTIDKTVYRSITTGGNFDPSRFNSIKNDLLNKPRFGFWACLKDGDNKTAWEELAEAEEFDFVQGKTAFDFVLSDNAKLLSIETIEAYENAIMEFGIDMPYAPGASVCAKTLDYERMSTIYDAMFISQEVVDEYRMKQDYSTYTYDVESLVVFNPDVIEAV